MDPLSVLRQFAVEQRLDSVRVEGGRVAFGDQYAFPARALTRFKGQGGQLLTLEAAVVFIQNIPQGVAAYVKACQEAGVPLVQVTDRKPLRDFLQGSNEPAALARLVDAAEVPVGGEGAAALAAAGGGAAALLASSAEGARAGEGASPAAAEAALRSAEAAAADERAALKLLDAAAADGEAAATGRATKRPRLDASSLAAASAAPPVASAGAAAAEAAALRLLARQERQLRDRNTMLLAPNRAFTRVLQIAEAVDARRRRQEEAAAAEKRRSQQQQQQQQQLQQQQQQQQQRARAPGGGGANPAAGGANPAGQPSQRQDPNAFIKSSGRFEREDAAAGTLRAMAGGDAAAAGAGLLAADVGLGYGGGGGGGAGGGGQDGLPPRLPQQQQPRPPQQQQQQKQQRHPSSSRPPPPSSSARGGGGGAPSRHAPSSAAVPLIIVPAAMSAMLNIYNARAFLAEGKFVPSGEAYAKDPTREGGPAGLVAFERSALRAPPLPTYQVTDAVPPPRSPDWARVVAVVVQGKAWQFRDWPFKGAAQGGEFSFLLFSPLSVLRVRFFFRPCRISFCVFRCVRVPSPRTW